MNVLALLQFVFACVFVESSTGVQQERETSDNVPSNNGSKTMTTDKNDGISV